MPGTNTKSPELHEPPHGLPRVAFQGVPGSFSELAIRQLWPLGSNVLPQRTFQDAVDQVLSGRAHFAVIPVENAIIGPVGIALEALEAAGNRVQRGRELQLEVHLCLMGPLGSTLQEIRNVLSHPVALAQCGNFFAKHHWLTPVPHGDTGSAAREVATIGDPHTGAIASEVAATMYGLEIVARKVADIPVNWTRFVVISLV